MYSWAVMSVIALGLIGLPNRPTADGDRSCGRPLFITPYLEKGETMKARNAARSSFLVQGKKVVSFSGFLTVDKEYDSNLFFWFFPAEIKCDKAPLVLWLQGGPGWSSLYGALMETGPFFINKHNRPGKRRYYWTQTMNVIYIDNPVGTGFSFTRNEAGYATTQGDVGNDLYAALKQFFHMFPELKNNKFIIAGESYAGKFISTLAYIVHERNYCAEEKINLVGLVIGNGCIDPRNMLGYSDYLYQHGLVDDNGAAQIKRIEQRIAKFIDEEMFYEAAIESHSLRGNVTNFIEPASIYDYTTTGNSKHDFNKLKQYLSQSAVRKKLHVGHLTFNDGRIAANYLLSDLMKSVRDRFEELLDYYPVMLYSGQLDVLIPYPVTIKFLKTLNWSGAKEYAEAPREKLFFRKHFAGYAKTVGNLTEVLVRGAGHMAVKDQPKRILQMVTRFTQGSLLNLP